MECWTSWAFHLTQQAFSYDKGWFLLELIIAMQFLSSFSPEGHPKWPYVVLVCVCSSNAHTVVEFKSTKQ